MVYAFKVDKVHCKCQEISKGYKWSSHPFRVSLLVNHRFFLVCLEQSSHVVQKLHLLVANSEKTKMKNFIYTVVNI